MNRLSARRAARGVALHLSRSVLDGRGLDCPLAAVRFFLRGSHVGPGYGAGSPDVLSARSHCGSSGEAAKPDRFRRGAAHLHLCWVRWLADWGKRPAVRCFQTKGGLRCDPDATYARRRVTQTYAGGPRWAVEQAESRWPTRADSARCRPDGSPAGRGAAVLAGTASAAAVRFENTECDEWVKRCSIRCGADAPPPAGSASRLTKYPTCERGRCRRFVPAGRVPKSADGFAGEGASAAGPTQVRARRPRQMRLQAGTGGVDDADGGREGRPELPHDPTVLAPPGFCLQLTTGGQWLPDPKNRRPNLAAYGQAEVGQPLMLPAGTRPPAGSVCTQRAVVQFGRGALTKCVEGVMSGTSMEGIAMQQAGESPAVLPGAGTVTRLTQTRSSAWGNTLCRPLYHIRDSVPRVEISPVCAGQPMAPRRARKGAKPSRFNSGRGALYVKIYQQGQERNRSQGSCGGGCHQVGTVNCGRSLGVRFRAAHGETPRPVRGRLFFQATGKPSEPAKAPAGRTLPSGRWNRPEPQGGANRRPGQIHSEVTK